MAHTFHQNNEVEQLIALAAQGSLNTGWFSPFADGMANRAVIFAWIGTISSGTVAVKVTQATSAAGAGAKDVTDAAITTFTTATDERIRSIDLKPDNLDNKNGFTFIRVEVTVSTGTPIYGILLNKYALRYAGLIEQHATYDEQIEVGV